MGKGGRPRKEIDQKNFEFLCSIQCTMLEICAYFDVTDKTLTNWCKRKYGKSFSEVFAEKRKIGNISLRRAQFQMAQTNPTMSIWLGKQYLDQTDQVKIDTSEVMHRLDDVLNGVKEDALEEVEKDGTEPQAEGIHSESEPTV